MKERKIRWNILTNAEKRNNAAISKVKTATLIQKKKKIKERKVKNLLFWQFKQQAPTVAF